MPTILCQHNAGTSSNGTTIGSRRTATQQPSSRAVRRYDHPHVHDRKYHVHHQDNDDDDEDNDDDNTPIAWEEPTKQQQQQRQHQCFFFRALPFLRTRHRHEPLIHATSIAKTSCTTSSSMSSFGTTTPACKNNDKNNMQNLAQNKHRGGRFLLHEQQSACNNTPVQRNTNTKTPFRNSALQAKMTIPGVDNDWGYFVDCS